MMSAPRVARSRAIPAPIPREDPVTNAILPSRGRWDEGIGILSCCSSEIL